MTNATSASQAPPAARGRFASGIAFALVSAAAFGSSGSFGKSLIETGWSPGAAVTARIGVAAVILLGPALLALRGRWGLLVRNARSVVVYGLVAMAACQLFYFNAVTTLSVGVALLLEYLGPILVVLWLWVRHGLAPRRWTLLGVGLALIGLVLVLDVAAGIRVDLGGVLWGLGAAVGLAVFFVISADESIDLPPIVMAAGGMVVATLGLGLAGLLGLMPMTASRAPVTLAGAHAPWWVAVVVLALVAAALAYSSGIAAARRLGSKVASFVGLTEVLFAVLIAWLVVAELPTPVQLLGGVFIVGGVLAIRYDEATAVPALARKASAEPGTRAPEQP